MNVEIKYRHSNTAAKIHLNSGEEITAEAGSMIAMSPSIQVETTTHKKGSGNFLKSMKRLLIGESFFLNHYTANQPGEVWLSSTLPGDMICHELKGENLAVQASSFVACEKTVDMDIGWQGFKNLFSGESLFWIKLSGTGKVILNSFGSIYEEQIVGDYTVDTGHIVAFEDTLGFKLSKAGSSWFKSFLSGEGITCNFSGAGKIYCQSHNPQNFGTALSPYLKVKKR